MDALPRDEPFYGPRMDREPPSPVSTANGQVASYLSTHEPREEVSSNFLQCQAQHNRKRYAKEHGSELRPSRSEGTLYAHLLVSLKVLILET